MQKWEYLIVQLYEDGMFKLPDNTKGHIDDLGRHGWEMISCHWFDHKSGRGVFKRTTTRVEIGKVGDMFGVRFVDKE